MNFEEQKKLLDVEWFEGPLMSLFSNNKGDLYIYKWVDVGPSGHTWLVFRTNSDLLVAYVQQDISEKALILLAPGKVGIWWTLAPHLISAICASSKYPN